MTQMWSLHCSKTFKNRSQEPPPGSFPGMHQGPPSPSFQSLTIGLCESGLEAAWDSLRAGFSPSYHHVSSGLKRGFLQKQADPVGRCPWLETTQFMCFQHKSCFSTSLEWGSGKYGPPDLSMGLGRVECLFIPLVLADASVHMGPEVANRTRWEPDSKRLKLSHAGFSNSAGGTWAPCGRGHPPQPPQPRGPQEQAGGGVRAGRIK